MAFDLSTATPVDEETPTRRFDLSTERPVEEEASPRSFFESPAADILFPGIGGMLGTVAGGTLGGAAGGIGAAPGAFVGGTTGAGAGKSLQQMLASLTGHGPKTIQETYSAPITEAATEAVGMGAVPFLRGFGGRLGRLGRAGLKRVGQLTTSIAPESIERVFERGASRVITPEYQAFAKGGVPERIQTGVIQGFDKFRGTAEDQYDKALASLRPRFKEISVNLQDVTERFQKRLTDAGVLTESGKSARPVLGRAVASEVSRSNQKLVSILEKFQSFRGGFLSLEKAIRLKRELDTFLDFDPNAVRSITKPSQAILFSLRSSLKEAMEEIVPEMKTANDRYHLFRDLYDVIQPRLRDPNIESTLRNLTRNRNTFNFRVLQDIDAQLPDDEKFLAQTLDFLAGSEFGKDPELFRFLPFAIAGTLSPFVGGGPLGSAAALLTGAELTSPRAFGSILQGAERIAAPVIAGSKAVQPFVPSGSSSLIRMLRGTE